MTTLTEKFDALRAQMALEALEADIDRNVTNVKLQAIFDALDLIIVNNAANTRAILAAIGQNSPCTPCPTPPILIPPIGETPLPINGEACQRAQAFLNFMTGAFTVLDLASSVGIGFNPSLITDAFNQVIATLGGTDEPDTISFPEAVQLVGSLVSYIATNLLVGNTLVGEFTPMYADLRDALATSGSADAAKVEYDAIVLAGSSTSEEKAVMIDAAYSAAYTYFFDPASEPNLAGTDPDACGIATCETMSSAPTSVNGGGATAIIVWAAPFVGLTHNGAGTTADNPVWSEDDLSGYIITATRDFRAFHGPTNLGDTAAGSPFSVPPGQGTFLAIVGIGAGGAFTAEVCPPA